MTFPIVVYLPNKTLRLQWANDMEECVCPPSDSITQCECNINSHSLPRASDVDNTIYFDNLTVQANNTKVYFVYSVDMPRDMREVAKSYQIIICDGKFNRIYSIILAIIIILFPEPPELPEISFNTTYKCHLLWIWWLSC